MTYTVVMIASHERNFLLFINQNMIILI